MNPETQLGVDRTYTMALGYMRQNKYGDAVGILEHVVGTDPKNTLAFLNLAICHTVLAEGYENPRISSEESANHIDKAISATEKAHQLLQDAEELDQRP